MLATTTLSTLRDMVSQAIGDYLSFDSSTNLSTGSTAKVIASTLANYDQGQGDIYNGWFLHVTEGNNAGKVRTVKDYLSTSQTLKLYGSAWAAEAAAVTVGLHRFDPRNKVRAINRAIDMLYPSLFKDVDDMTLVGGNWLPDASFEWWTSSSALKMYSTSNVTLAKTSSGANTRGQLGTFSAKATSTAGNGYFYISSNSYPKLLDLMGKTVDMYCMAAPEVANDASIVIYTKQADGTAQTLTSITTCPAGEFTLLSLIGQALNDNLVEIEIRFKITTNAKYVYFDDAWIGSGTTVGEFLLPPAFQTGTLSSVYQQTSGYSDVPFYDLHPKFWQQLEWDIISDGVYRYLKPVEKPTNWRRLRLKGYTQLESLSADTDTISLDGPRLNLIVAFACHLLYEMEKGTVSSEDKGRYDQESAYWLAKCRMLTPTLMMMRPQGTLR